MEQSYTPCSFQRMFFSGERICVYLRPLADVRKMVTPCRMLWKGKEWEVGGWGRRRWDHRFREIRSLAVVRFWNHIFLLFPASQKSKQLSSRWARTARSEMLALVKRSHASCWILTQQRGAEVRAALWSWNYFCSEMWHDLLVVTTDLTMTSDLGLPLISELIWAKT